MAEVVGISETPGIAGVRGESSQGSGVLGSTTGDGHAGVMGVNDLGNGSGVFGRSARGAGVHGVSAGLNGVLGVTTAVEHAAVAGLHEAAGIAVFGRSAGGLAGFFEGDVQVTGDIRLTNADCAEEFTIAGDGPAQPGTVMVLCDDGSLQPSTKAYDRRVAGVISGAGAYKPGIVLDKQAACENRQAVALLGKVYCQVDADQAPIVIGDLLTTSTTPGHAMRASDPARAYGAVIGKALGSLPSGCGLMPVLVALQ